MGLDLHDPAFWAKGYGLLRELIMELKGLLAEEKQES